MKVEINAEFLTTFDTFNEWVNKASSRIGGYPPSDIIICLDKNGGACNIGKDFMFAKDNELFPVTAYRLIRNTENKP